MPGPAWIVQHAPGQGDKVGLTSGNDSFCLSRVIDHADGHGGQPGFTANVIGKSGLITWAHLNFLQRAVAA